MENLLDKKTCILESALGLIHEQGFHGCPISQVAKNAGVAAGTIYTYFESKDDMILTIFDYTVNKIKKYVSDLDDATLDFKSRFFNYWQNLSEFYVQNPTIHGFYDQFLNSPYYLEANQNQINPWHEWSCGFFQQGIDLEELKSINPTILSILVNSNINSVVRIKNNFKTKLARKNLDLGEISQLLWEGIKK